MTVIHAHLLEKHSKVSSHNKKTNKIAILFNVYFISGGVKAIVADVILGNHGKNQTKQPVMRQTNNQSDFSFDEFITQTIAYHVKNKNRVKIIKLNFVSLDVVPKSIDILLANQKKVRHHHYIHFYLKSFDLHLNFISKSID